MNRRSARNRHRRHAPSTRLRDLRNAQGLAMDDMAESYDKFTRLVGREMQAMAREMVLGPVVPGPPADIFDLGIPRIVPDRQLVRIRYEDGTEDVAELIVTHPPLTGTVRIE